MGTVKKRNIYTTTDGKEWDNEQDAESHEAILELKQYLIEDMELSKKKADEYSKWLIENAGAIEYRLRHFLGFKPALRT